MRIQLQLVCPTKLLRVFIASVLEIYRVFHPYRKKIFLSNELYPMNELNLQTNSHRNEINNSLVEIFNIFQNNCRFHDFGEKLKYTYFISNIIQFVEQKYEKYKRQP